jgi:hypothetical protein
MAREGGGISATPKARAGASEVCYSSAGGGNPTSGIKSISACDENRGRVLGDQLVP